MSTRMARNTFNHHSLPQLPFTSIAYEIRNLGCDLLKDGKSSKDPFIVLAYDFMWLIGAVREKEQTRKTRQQFPDVKASSRILGGFCDLNLKGDNEAIFREALELSVSTLEASRKIAGVSEILTGMRRLGIGVPSDPKPVCMARTSELT